MSACVCVRYMTQVAITALLNARLAIASMWLHKMRPHPPLSSGCAWFLHGYYRPSSHMERNGTQGGVQEHIATASHLRALGRGETIACEGGMVRGISVSKNHLPS